MRKEHLQYNFNQAVAGEESLASQSLLAPPLGVKPRFIHNKERIEDITNAMLRMLSCNTEIYIEWIEELRDLIPEYNSHIKSPEYARNKGGII